MKYQKIITIVLVIAISIFFISWYFRGTPPTMMNITIRPSPTISVASRSTAYKVEKFVGDLTVPWSLVFTSHDRLLVAERPGDIRIVQKGKLLDQPLYTFSDVVKKSQEGGLMGLAIHPQYQQNKYIYASYDYMDGDKTFIKIVRLIDENTTAKFDRIILDGLPGGSLHTSARLKFGPDGFLYIALGDTTDKSLAQDRSSLAGKILRITDTGSVPASNPFPGSPVYSYGHRNPEGIAWEPGTGRMYSTEHGPSGFDGPGGGDELNIILPGKSYGWPIVSHDKSAPGHVSPIMVWTPALAPASAEFYTGQEFPQFYGNLFFGGLTGKGLFRVVLDSTGQKVVMWEKFPEINVGRIRDVVTGPDGYIYFSTSNKDGRGIPKSGDDMILRLVPQK